MKRSFQIIGIAIVIGLLFKGSLYRWLVNYTEIGTRPAIEITNTALIASIENKTANKSIHFASIITIADEITKETLTFTFDKASNNPNALFQSKRANCVGYAAMFNAIATYLIQKHQLQQELKATHKIGHLYFLGINLHQFFESPFFSDHDFNELLNKQTGEIVSIDPSVSDYLGIERITEK